MTPAPTTAPSGSSPATGSPPAETATPSSSAQGDGLAQYDCPNDNSNIGHYVPSGRFWTEGFIPRGTQIRGGHLQLGANADGHDHTARIGIYGDFGTTSPLAEVTVPVNGYGGVDFTFPSTVAVAPGTTYYVTASGIGDFTAYDSRSGCLIGRLVG